MNVAAPEHKLLRPVDGRRDHVRGGANRRGRVTVLIYGDYLCPYCQRLSPVLARLRETLGDRMAYVFRHFPNEQAHPGAEYLARASEAAGRQGRFWEMHDAFYGRQPPPTPAEVMEIAQGLGLEMARFARDLDDVHLRRRVDEDIKDARRNGVSGTPTIFIDGVRYDGAWDFYSLLEALERPVGAQVQRTARAFANLPTSAGLVLLLAAAAALACANTSLAPAYLRLVETPLGLGPSGRALTMSLADWCSDGLLSIFFLIVGLEIRREMTAGSLSNPRAIAAPVLAAAGGIVAPAAVYLALNRNVAAPGWSTPGDTGTAFVLGMLAVFGSRATASLKAFVAAYAVAEDIVVLLILAIFYPRSLHLEWLAGSALIAGAMLMLNRWRVYALWAYIAGAFGLWFTLHMAGVNAALSGVLLAALLPTRPTPAAAPLLAQAATALAELEHAQALARGRPDDKRRLEQEPVWEWASRNLSAAAARLLSPAERIERSLAPWSTYVVLPLFAFTCAGVPLNIEAATPADARIVWGVALGLALGKPLGIVGATWAAVRARLAVGPADATPLAFLGAACLCGIGDPISILVADQAFDGGPQAALAKLGVLAGSALSVALGSLALGFSHTPATAARPAPAPA